EDAVDQEVAGLGRAQGEVVAEPLLVLLLGVLLGVDGVPVVEASLVELARRVFAGQGKQLGFLETFADRLRRPRHDREMGKPISPPSMASALRGISARRSPTASRS